MCNNRFSECFSGSLDQGYGCASTMFDHKISCGYGSKYDFNLYEWITPIRPLIYRNVKTICDECIDDLITSEQIILIR